VKASSPYHAHIYYAEDGRALAEGLRDRFLAMRPDVLFVGRMMDRGVGPHPVPQFEIHFLEASVPAIVDAIEASGLRALVHPLTDDDVADHTALGRWIGEPLELVLSALDPPGHNQGVARFGKSDF
jgi:aromatic ring-cleaving dioxygenase